ncbi:MAG TPA: hypothetical protein VN804_00880, partial [Solirubrobacteraceae bacterium]|nr:hypothetical protein [Solirubrobacteraceae bacterium]
MISALLVGIISIAIVSGFVSAGHATANERSHGQATLVASQDQERLRTQNPTTLVQFGNETYLAGETGARCTTKCATGTTFTVESRAEYVSGNVENAKKEHEDLLTCSAGSNATPNFIKTTTKVTWSEVGRPQEVTQSSLVAVPNGSAVEVKVVDQNGTPLNGATVTVTGATTNLSQTTVKQGCVVFGAIADKTVEVDASKSGWVGTQGVTPAAKSTTPSSESVTPSEFTLAMPGAIQAKFSSNGATVSGETIFATQAKMGTKGLGAGVVGTPASAVTLSGLYPFIGPNTYSVFAGDCEANNPETVTSKVVKDATAQVEAGATREATVELPPLNITVMSGTKAGASTAGTAVTST